MGKRYPAGYLSAVALSLGSNSTIPFQRNQISQITVSKKREKKAGTSGASSTAEANCATC